MNAVVPFLEKARKAESANVLDEMTKLNELRRCKWWNRGYCQEKDKCSFFHPPEDCREHLNHRCTSKGCNLSHRQTCMFFATEAGCHRGDLCAYLHQEDPGVRDVVGDKKNEENDVTKDVEDFIEKYKKNEKVS